MTISIVGQRIRVFRLKAGLTQEALAEKANVHPTYIGQVERGEKNLTITTLSRILAALDVSFSEFFSHMSISNSLASIPEQCYEIIIQMPDEMQQHVYQILTEVDKMVQNK